MRIFLMAVSALFFSLTILAQDAAVKDMREEALKTVKKDEKDSSKKAWTSKGTISLNLAQGGSSNWAAGAERFSIALAAIGNFQLNYQKGDKSWENSLDLNYAFINSQTNGFRKLDDRIDFLSKYSIRLSPKSNFYGSMVASFRTQFVDGYNYNSETGNTRVSSFMAPANIVLSPGLSWKPNNWFNVFLSPISTRFIIVSNRPYELGALYGVDPEKKYRLEIGAFLTANLDKDIAKNIHLKSRLDLYSNYKGNAKNVDVFFTNIVTLKVNKWLNVTYNFDLIYDDDAINPKTGSQWGTQLKSLLGVGFALKL